MVYCHSSRPTRVQEGREGIKLKSSANLLELEVLDRFSLRLILDSLASQGLNAVGPVTRPWFVFWISHALEILSDFDERHWSPQALVASSMTTNSMCNVIKQHEKSLSDMMFCLVLYCYPAIFRDQVASFLLHCQDPTGGFAGGPQQLPHLAPTYAAVSALMVAGTEEAYQVGQQEPFEDVLGG